MYNNLNDLINEFDKVFAQASKNVKNSIYVDVLENEDGYKVLASLPGVRKEDIVLDIEDSNLTISVKEKESDENKKYYIHERVEGYYPRTIYLKNVDSNELKAKFEDGILEIDCPFTKKNVRNIVID